MRSIDFKFKLPSKKSDDNGTPPAAPEKSDKAEPEPDEGEGYTKAELGKMLASAMKSGDGEAIWEAFRKLQDSTPTDADE